MVRDMFWERMEELVDETHIVVVSEYTCDHGLFESVWEKPSRKGAEFPAEHLFMHESVVAKRAVDVLNDMSDEE